MCHACFCNKGLSNEVVLGTCSMSCFASQGLCVHKACLVVI